MTNYGPTRGKQFTYNDWNDMRHTNKVYTYNEICDGQVQSLLPAYSIKVIMPIKINIA